MTMLHSDLVNAGDFMITEWEQGCFYVHILGLTMAMINFVILCYHSNQQPNFNTSTSPCTVYNVKHRCAESTDKKCMLTMQ